mmetsp:Transcript_27689/g.77425  ORF Transcript_27689/g.77425 Transcript_27689/m.77425 type:complete len:95 (-) Transcript_27689:315-599(-)
MRDSSTQKDEERDATSSFKNASSSTHAEQKHGVECGPSVPLYWHEAKETYAGSSTEPNRPVEGSTMHGAPNSGESPRAVEPGAFHDEYCALESR